MARSYPIWNDVTACIYQSGKSWGAKEDSNVTIKVGNGSRNSHDFVSIRTLKVEDDEHIVFKFYVDKMLVKESYFENKSGVAGLWLEDKIYLQTT